MKPVICFYESETYIYSTDYYILSCPATASTSEFLTEIENKYFSLMKIIQLDFDAYAKAPSSLEAIYKSPKASVYILKNFQILSLREIQLKHLSLLRIDAQRADAVSYMLMTSKKQFTENVNKIKTMIAAGRLYQVNLTSAFKAENTMDGLQFFLTKVQNFTGAYKCYLPGLNELDISIISFSPELFLEKKEGILKTAPIKGSMTLTSADNNNLMRSEKEEAELSMVVDLLRNDLNSLEILNSAKVNHHRQLMDLNYIQHTYSEVQIKTETTLPTILKKIMPGGSISGCPKKESLQVIAELELTQRHAYTGNIGWWHKDQFKLNVAIRSFVKTLEYYYYFAGCGVVFDSDPEKEFTELLAKAGPLNVFYN